MLHREQNYWECFFMSSTGFVFWLKFLSLISRCFKRSIKDKMFVKYFKDVLLLTNRRKMNPSFTVTKFLVVTQFLSLENLSFDATLLELTLPNKTQGNPTRPNETRRHTTRYNQTQPDPTRPNQTQADLSKHNQTQPEPSSGMWDRYVWYLKCVYWNT